MQQHENWARKSTCPRRQTEWHLCTYGQSTEMTSLSRRTTQPSTEREAVERYNGLHCDGASKQTDEWNCWWANLLNQQLTQMRFNHTSSCYRHCLDLGIRWQGICNYEDSDQRLRTRFTRDFLNFCSNGCSKVNGLSWTVCRLSLISRAPRMTPH